MLFFIENKNCTDINYPSLDKKNNKVFNIEKFVNSLHQEKDNANQVISYNDLIKEIDNRLAQLDKEVK